MKIAITGHTNGIGKSLARILEDRGHNIIGISRRDGENIRRVAHTASLIDSCEIFINNAQSHFAQTELFYEVWKKWRGQKKWIWNISSQMTSSPVDTKTEHDEIDISLYRVQKMSLEEASRQLQYKSSLPKITVVKPGRVKENLEGSNTPEEWASQLVKILCDPKGMHIGEISLINSIHNFEI